MKLFSFNTFQIKLFEFALAFIYLFIYVFLRASSTHNNTSIFQPFACCGRSKCHFGMELQSAWSGLSSDEIFYWCDTCFTEVSNKCGIYNSQLQRKNNRKCNRKLCIRQVPLPEQNRQQHLYIDSYKQQW